MINNSASSIFTVIIPLIPQHDFYLKRIFRILAHEQQLINEVIICRSESKKHITCTEKKLLRYAQSVGFTKNISVNHIGEVAPDGTNRNRGWKVASSELVAFLDADDLYGPNRLASLLAIFKSTDADAILHSYNSSGMLNETHAAGESESLTSRRVGLKQKASGVDCIVDKNGVELKAHYAHITVRNSIKDTLMFTDRFPGADLEFATQLVSKGFKMEYVQEELSAWNRHRSLRYKFRLLKMRYLKN